MRTLLASALALAAIAAGVPAVADPAGGIPSAIYTDPITDSAHPGAAWRCCTSRAVA